MLCPRCHGKGYVLDWMGREKCPCPNPDCHAGQVSCSEGSERTGGETEPSARLRVRPGSMLDRQVKMAQKEMKIWPQWMKDAAHF